MGYLESKESAAGHGAPAHKVPTIELAAVEFVGAGLHRPECVLCTANGAVFAADWGGGVTRIDRDGRQDRFLAKGDFMPKPNGIALRPDGSFLLAHLGADDGGLFHLARDGTLSPVLTEVAGEALPPSNFVLDDGCGRLWLTVSTRRRPRDLGYRRDVADGFVVLIDDRGARVAADGLGYTNEVALDARGDWLYVNETFARRLSRFRVGVDGTLSGKETVSEFGPGTFPDGLAFDAEGALWITSIVSNRVIRVAPDGAQEVVLEDSDPDHLAWIEDAFQAGVLGRPHLDGIKSRALKNLSSLAFGGPDLKTAYLGCLLGDNIARVRLPVAGRPPVHWAYPA